jgi:hypothetical protein
MRLPQLHVGLGQQIGPLTVFPLWTAAPAPSDLLTGSAAEVEAAEADGAPEVTRLQLHNVGNLPALLLEGELLEGGWQHRVLQHDVILGPGESQQVSVNCVERGRWHGASPHTTTHWRASTRIRSALAQADDGDRQTRVWAEIDEYDAVTGPTPTHSFVDQLERLSAPAGCPDPNPAAADLDEALTQLRGWSPRLGQRGFMVGVAGQPVLTELFADSHALAQHVPPTLTGMLMDAVAAGAGGTVTPSRRARRLATRLAGLRDQVVHVTALQRQHVLLASV